MANQTFRRNARDGDRPDKLSGTINKTLNYINWPFTIISKRASALLLTKQHAFKNHSLLPAAVENSLLSPFLNVPVPSE